MDVIETGLEIKKEFPDFKIVRKEDSGLMHAIDFFLKVISFGKMNRFMQDFTTTIYHTIYTPSDWDSMTDAQIVGVLKHEAVHMRQANKYSFPIYSFLYLFFPLPAFFAYFRAKFEMEAYEVTMKVAVERSGPEILSNEKFKKFITSQFTGPSYLWMFPFEDKVNSWYEETAKRIINQ